MTRPPHDWTLSQPWLKSRRKNVIFATSSNSLAAFCFLGCVGLGGRLNRISLQRAVKNVKISSRRGFCSTQKAHKSAQDQSSEPDFWWVSNEIPKLITVAEIQPVGMQPRKAPLKVFLSSLSSTSNKKWASGKSSWLAWQWSIMRAHNGSARRKEEESGANDIVLSINRRIYEHKRRGESLSDWFLCASLSISIDGEKLFLLMSSSTIRNSIFRDDVFIFQQPEEGLSVEAELIP